MAYATQKARQTHCLWHISKRAYWELDVAPVYAVMPHTIPVTFPCFARPCPTMPRHGFVDSCLVNNLKEAKALFKKARAADPQAEMICMPKLTGQCSAVATAAGIAWGLGNDGVTAGKSEVFNLPAPSIKFDTDVGYYLGEDFAPNNGLYLELVEHNFRMHLVQARTGPKLPMTFAKRWVPTLRYIPNHILQLVPAYEKDITKWEAAVKHYAGTNTAAWLPGHSLSSHYAVHALAAGLAIETGENPPKCGELMSPDNDGDTSITNERARLVGEALRLYERESFGEHLKYREIQRMLAMSVAIVHCLPYWGSEPHLARLTAYGMYIALRFGLAAVLGEARHWAANVPTNDEGSHVRPQRVDWEALGDFKSAPSNRDVVFAAAHELPLCDIGRWAKAASKDLSGWGGTLSVAQYKKRGESFLTISVGYGGPLWEWAAINVARLSMAVNRLITKPNAGALKRAIAAYNNIITAAHNSNYLFTKWVSKESLDRAVRVPSIEFLNNKTASFIFPDIFKGEPERTPSLVGSQFRLSRDLHTIASLGLVPLNLGGGPWACKLYVHKRVANYLSGKGESLTGCICSTCLTGKFTDLYAWIMTQADNDQLLTMIFTSSDVMDVIANTPLNLDNLAEQAANEEADNELEPEDDPECENDTLNAE